MGNELKVRPVRGSVSIDHAAGALQAGLDLADDVVVFFGNPAIGTGVMRDDPRAGIDLPLRILFWDDKGTTYLAYRDPQELAEVFDLVDGRDVPAKPSEFMTTLASDLRAER